MNKKDEAMLAKIFDAAQLHERENVEVGEESGAEAGDLADALRACWKIMTSEQRKTVFDSLELWGS